MPRKKKLPPNVRRHRSGFRGVIQIDKKRRYGDVFATPEAAAEWVREMRSAVRAPLEGGTLAQAFGLLIRDVESTNGSPMTVRAYRGGWAVVKKHHFEEATPCVRITAAQIRAAVDRELRRTSAAGAQKLLTHLKLILGAAKRGGLVTTNVAKGIRRPKHRQRQLPPFTFEQIHGIADRLRGLEVAGHGAKPEEVADWILVAAYLGTRRSELSRMRADDADFGTGRVLIRGKNRNRFVPIAAEAVEPLRRVIAAGMFPKNPTSLGNRLRFYCVKLKLGRMTVHQFRRSFATRLALQGVSPYVLRDLLGHANLQQTLTYYQGVESHAVEAVRLLRPAAPATDPRASPEPEPGSS